jgi:hypothetical protein
VTGAAPGELLGIRAPSPGGATVLPGDERTAAAGAATVRRRIGGMAASQPPGPPQAPAAPTTQPAGSTGVLEREETRHQAEPGDHERYAHYVRKEKILASAVSGQPVVALCGKVWTPSRDPSRFPVCPACKAIYESLRGGGGDDADAGGAGSGQGADTPGSR